MVRVTIHSRTGNRVLAIAGVVYAIAGLLLFGWFVADTWGAASLIDRALQFTLFCAVAIAVWFVYVARVNLTDVSARQPSRQHRANAAATT